MSINKKSHLLRSCFTTDNISACRGPTIKRAAEKFLAKVYCFIYDFN